MYRVLFILLIPVSVFAQSEAYTEKKENKLAQKSPFEKIVDRELPATIEYEDDEIIAFVPLRKQAPVHFLIVPKKRIPTLNDLNETQSELMGKMVLVAAEIAKKNGISETGYRLSVNTNEDSGQSVFHIHVHLLGGKKLGPMVTQDYSEE